MNWEFRSGFLFNSEQKRWRPTPSQPVNGPEPLYQASGHVIMQSNFCEARAFADQHIYAQGITWGQLMRRAVSNEFPNERGVDVLRCCVPQTMSRCPLLPGFLPRQLTPSISPGNGCDRGQAGGLVCANRA